MIPVFGAGSFSVRMSSDRIGGWPSFLLRAPDSQSHEPPLLMIELSLREDIRSPRGGIVAHKEIPQLKKVLGSIDLKGAAKHAAAMLGREMNGYTTGQRVRGGMKEDRDLVVYALWEMGAFRNEEIGQVFGVSYSAVSHIVRNVKEYIKKDPRVGRKVKKLNSQFKTPATGGPHGGCSKPYDHKLLRRDEHDTLPLAAKESNLDLTRPPPMGFNESHEEGAGREILPHRRNPS